VSEARPSALRYRHDALFHATDDDLVASAVPFLRAGLDAGDAVVLMCDAPTTDKLTSAVGDSAAIGHLPRADSYRRTTAVIAGFCRVVDRAVADGASRVRLVGDVDLGVPADEEEWGRYEAVCNAALAALPVWSLCLYDTARLPASVVTAGRSTHPYLLNGTQRTHNAGFVEPVEYLRRSAPTGVDPVEADAADVNYPDLGRDDLGRLRGEVQRVMADRGASATTIDGFTVAINEVVANALQHGLQPVSVGVWSTPKRTMCVVSDSGPGFDNPLAGYVTPASGTPGSRGLYLARHLCDRVSFEHAGRFTVRVAVSH
jgi:anti-sigma regulatory factor (Ser/Thr protein kinase)